MNVILVSPNFPSNLFNFAVCLQRAGANVLAIGDAPYQSLRPELRDAVIEYYRVDSLERYDGVLRACGYFTYRYGKIDRIESHNEHWLASDALIRADFNIPGILPSALARARSKIFMREHLASIGLAVPHSAPANDRVAVAKLVSQAGFPLIAKPETGIDLAAVRIVQDGQSLEELLEERQTPALMLEESLRGDLYTFDGLCGRDGNPFFTTAHWFWQEPRQAGREAQDLSYSSLREIPAGLREAGLAAIRLFDAGERFFSLEFILTPDDRFVALAVNLRPPGGLTLDMMNYANDTDLYQAWADIVMGREAQLPAASLYHCGYAGRRSGMPYRHSHTALVAALGDQLVQHEPLPPVSRPFLGDHGYLVRHPELDDVRAALGTILDTV